MTHVLRARRLLTEEGWLDDHQLRIADGVIAAIEPIPVGVTERDAELLCPAYIDTHVHGGAGVDVMDDAPDVLDKLAMHKAREGVGSWLPTTVTAPLNSIHAALKRIAQRCQRGGPGAQVLGSYLEGPYFTPQNKGAHPPELPLGLYLREAQPRHILVRMLRNLKALYSAPPDWHKLLNIQERLVILLPDEIDERRDRGLAYAALECPQAALQDLKAYLSARPDADDVRELRSRLPELESACRRMN